MLSFSGPDVTDGPGLYSWKASYTVVVTILIPSELWLATYSWDDLKLGNAYDQIEISSCDYIESTDFNEKSVKRSTNSYFLLASRFGAIWFGFGQNFLFFDSHANEKAYANTVNNYATYILFIPAF